MSTEIAKKPPQVAAMQIATNLTPEEWKMFKDMSVFMAKSELVGRAFQKRPEDVMMACIVAHGLGIHPSIVLTKGVPVNGRIYIEENVRHGMVRARVPDFDFEVLEHTDKICTLKGWRKGKKPKTVTYTWEDAQKAQNVNKDNYKKHPKDMMYHRCMTRLLDQVAPDAVYNIPKTTYDELEEAPTDSGGESGTQVGLSESSTHPGDSPEAQGPEDEDRGPTDSIAEVLDDEGPPPASEPAAEAGQPADMSDESWAVQTGDERALIDMCARIQEKHGIALLLKRERQGETQIWFVHGPILAACGHTNDQGPVSQRIVDLSPNARKMLAKEVLNARFDSTKPKYAKA